jgi:DNA-binding transcriptional ArsR family regulator
MPSRLLAPLVRIEVSPRFDLFYALRVLHQPAGGYAAEWSQEVRGVLPKNFVPAVERVAPHPMMWPMLADSLRDEKSDPSFDEMIRIIRTRDDESFQRAVLASVFRGKDVVADLIAKRVTLPAAISVETAQQNALISLVGLTPFQNAPGVASAFERIVSSPKEYRAELADALEIFWDSAFSYTWKSLEPRLQKRAAMMREEFSRGSVASFARDERLPVVFDERSRTVRSSRGTMLFAFKSLRAIHFLPSAFNDSRFWGAYSDSSTSTKLYFPVFDSTLLEGLLPRSQQIPVAATAYQADPAIGFRALGDTTRYAIASLLAKTPRTSVELAKEFNVSKATISHHVQLLRAAALLDEQQTDHGVVLTLDRYALEALSRAAAAEMFSGNDNDVIKRSRRNKSSGESE